MERIEVPEQKGKDQEQAQTKYEMSLAEFPLFLLAKTPGKKIDSIFYTDTITVDNKPVKREWRVSWNEKLGPATQSTAETFFALFQIWADEGFKSEWIHFDSIMSILKRRGVTTSKADYQRTLRDLHCLCNLYIQAKNAFYDSEKKKYIDASFHLFESLILEKETDGNPDPTSRGFIKAHTSLHSAAQKNVFSLGVHEKQFFALSGLQQRLYLYLKKMFTFQKFNVRDIMDLASQIPLYCEKKKVKQQIKKAAQAILDIGVIPQFAGFRFYTHASGAEMVRFERSDAVQTSLFDQVKVDSCEGNYQMIKEICMDDHSNAFYRKVASLMSTGDICRALSETKEFANEKARLGQACTIPKVFTRRIMDLATERNIKLIG